MPRYLQIILLKRPVSLSGKLVRAINRIYDAVDDAEADIIGQGWYDDFIETTPGNFEQHVKDCVIHSIPDNGRTWFAISSTGVLQLERKADA